MFSRTNLEVGGGESKAKMQKGRRSGQGPRYELESGEGAVGAWGTAQVRKGVQWPAAAESSPREKGLRGAARPRAVGRADTACVTRGEGRPRRPLRPSKRR